MDYRKLIRDPKRVHEAIAELPDGRLVAKKAFKVYIPVRFEERGLASIGIETQILGIYAIVVEEAFYGVSLVNAMMKIEPTSTIKVSIDDEDYYEFFFEPGSTFCSSVDLVKRDTLTYKIYDELMSKGRVPWYIGYLELGKIFDTAKYHAGANVGSEQEVTELIVSIIARNAKDRNEFYRSSIKDLSDLSKNPPVFIPLRSVQYAASNTTNKLAGSYFAEGLASALVNPSSRTERIEKLLIS